MTDIAFRPHTLTEAVDEARKHEHGTPERYYWNGVVLGFLAARLPDGWGDKYSEIVNSDWLAQPVPVAQAVQLASLRGLLKPENRTGNDRLPRMMGVAGALWGFYEATADRPDAEECTSCGRRVLTASDDGWTECPEHGVVHDECRSGLCGRACQGEPEFDKDAYYADKYGDGL